MVFNTTFNNISVISWQSILLVEEIGVTRENPSSLAKGYDPLYSSSSLASLDGFSRSHGDGLYVMQLVVAATNEKALYKKHMFCSKNVN
jgi:hypothetical protein